MMEAHTEPVSQGSELYPHSDSKCVWEGRLSCVPQIIQVDTPPHSPSLHFSPEKERANKYLRGGWT